LAASFLQPSRHLAFDSYLVGFFAFAAVCRDIPNRPWLYRVGILWFAAFTCVAAVFYVADDGLKRVSIDDEVSHRQIPQ
jgi:hypothetical protein